MLWHVQPWWCNLLVMQAQQGERASIVIVHPCWHCPPVLVRHALVVVLLHFILSSTPWVCMLSLGMHCLAAADALAGQADGDIEW